MSAPERLSARGAAPVAQLHELGTVEARAVLYLRLWQIGPSGQDAVHKDLGDSGLRLLAEFAGICTQYARRPLMHHALTCTCVGGDEHCLAQLIAAAAEGEREDALMLAMVLVRPDVAPGLVALSAQLGLALRRLGRAPTPSGPGHWPTQGTYH